MALTTEYIPGQARDHHDFMLPRETHHQQRGVYFDLIGLAGEVIRCEGAVDGRNG
jgi:hypothetical protein